MIQSVGQFPDLPTTTFIREQAAHGRQTEKSEKHREESGSLDSLRVGMSLIAEQHRRDGRRQEKRGPVTFLFKPRLFSD